MKKRLALLAFLEGEGPWVRAYGDESSAEVHGLKEYEDLRIEIKGSIGGRNLIEGVNPIDYLTRGMIYRFIKRVPAGQKPSKTSVEVILNGSSSSRSDAGAERS